MQIKKEETIGHMAGIVMVSWRRKNCSLVVRETFRRGCG